MGEYTVYVNNSKEKESVMFFQAKVVRDVGARKPVCCECLRITSFH